MSTGTHNPYPFEIPDGSIYSFGIVSTMWNENVVGPLLQGCHEMFSKAGVREENIRSIQVPGSVELALGAQWLLESGNFDGVVCLGTVIRGETSHYDYVCKAATDGILSVSLKFSRPVIFGVLTVENLQQALDRAGGKLGNKGSEAALAALQMAVLRDHHGI